MLESVTHVRLCVCVFCSNTQKNKFNGKHVRNSNRRGVDMRHIKRYETVGGVDEEEAKEEEKTQLLVNMPLKVN